MENFFSTLVTAIKRTATGELKISEKTASLSFSLYWILPCTLSHSMDTSQFPNLTMKSWKVFQLHFYRCFSWGYNCLFTTMPPSTKYVSLTHINKLFVYLYTWSPRKKNASLDLISNRLNCRWVSKGVFLIPRTYNDHYLPKKLIITKYISWSLLKTLFKFFF